MTPELFFKTKRASLPQPRFQAVEAYAVVPLALRLGLFPEIPSNAAVQSLALTSNADRPALALLLVLLHLALARVRDIATADHLINRAVIDFRLEYRLPVAHSFIAFAPFETRPIETMCPVSS
jgi:hypothetical protein